MTPHCDIHKLLTRWIIRASHRQRIKKCEQAKCIMNEVMKKLLSKLDEP